MRQAIAKSETRSIPNPVKKPQPTVATVQTECPKPAVDAVRFRAYQCWEAAGKPEGDGASFWLEAERDLLQPR